MADLEIFAFTSIEAAAKKFALKQEIDNTFIRVLEYCKYYHNAKTILVESKYIDKDFSSELGNLYAKTFRCREGYCQRLHFIKEHFNNGELDALLSMLDTNKLTYLGFLVKRPIEVGKVGRTIILPHDDSNFFYLCCIEIDVHLLGRTIKTCGIPFIEQDSMVITCAQAAMWIVGSYMHHQHSLPRHFPYDITDKATTSFFDTGRPIPSSGLSLDQMIAALNNMGCFPVFTSRPRKVDFDGKDDVYEKELALWQPIETIYQYIESEVPVLLAFDRHIVTVIGHKMYDDLLDIDLDNLINKLREKDKTNKEVNPDSWFSAIGSTSLFTDAFIIHDDQRAIYGLLPCNERSYEALKDKHEGLLPQKRNGETSFSYTDINNSVQNIIIPLPDKIYLLGEDAFGIALKLFCGEIERADAVDILIKQDSKGNPYAKELVSSIDITEENPLLFRTYFIKSVDFKRKIRITNNMDGQIKHYYLAMDMPRFIWLVEITNYEIYSRTRCILGEILFDSTANKYDSNGSILSIHLPGYFYQNRRVSEHEIVNEEIPLEEPYFIQHRDHVEKCIIIGDEK